VGTVHFTVSDETFKYTDAEEYIAVVKEELPYRATTGFTFYTLTEDAAVRKAIDDLVYNEYGEQNPRELADYAEPQADLTAVREKPLCPLIGADGNVFGLLGLVSRTLKENGMKAEAAEMSERVISSGGYDKALAIMMEYVEPVSAEEMTKGMDFTQDF
ncbi:MAG: hypothetical protein LBT12_07455, partial [Oscillospiraceae bacterium]|nr:hypothetical protein [Oscillospiraceae bacterium]